MNWRFDLQLFFGGGENPQQSSADQYYQQEANNSNQLMQQWQTTYLPLIQKYAPLLMGTLNGQNTSLMQASEAPVNAATSSALNTMQNNVGGTTNPDALYADIAERGGQNAGLSADQTLLNSMGALQSLIGTGAGMTGTGMSGLNSAAGGEANLGGQLWNQQNAFWQDALGAVGQYYGYKTGNYQNQPNANAGGQNVLAGPGGSIYGGSSPSLDMANIPQNYGGTAPWMTALSQPGTSVNANNQSTPISSNNSSYGPQP